MRATLTTVSPLVGSDEALKSAVQAAKDFLATPGLMSAPAVAEGLTKRMEDAFAQGKRVVPAGYLDAQRERALLEQRQYQRRAVFGGKHLRALVRLGGAEPAPGVRLGMAGKAPPASAVVVPAYLPESLAEGLPMYPRFRVRMVAEIRLGCRSVRGAPGGAAGAGAGAGGGAVEGVSALREARRRGRRRGGGAGSSTTAKRGGAGRCGPGPGRVPAAEPASLMKTSAPTMVVPTVELHEVAPALLDRHLRRVDDDLRPGDQVDPPLRPRGVHRVAAHRLVQRLAHRERVRPADRLGAALLDGEVRVVLDQLPLLPGRDAVPILAHAHRLVALDPLQRLAAYQLAPRPVDGRRLVPVRQLDPIALASPAPGSCPSSPARRPRRPSADFARWWTCRRA